MKKQIIKLTLGLLAAAVIAAPAPGRAQSAAATTNAPAAQTPTARPKRTTVPFHGAITALDTNAMTLTIRQRTFDITSSTKITKAGKPAILGDLAVGDQIGGAFKKADDGKLSAVTVNVHEKPAAEPKQP
jgi:hypothetical protein